MPAAIVAIVFVDLGGLAFALFMIAIGCVCLHELYRMLGRWRPVPLVGFAALAGMVLAARFGSQREVLEVAMGAVPVLFLAVLTRPQRGGATVAIAGTLLGVYWIGFAFAHAVLLRQLHHGNAIIIDILVGTFLATPPPTSAGGCSAAGRSLPRSRRTRRLRVCSSGCSSRSCRCSSPGSTRTG